jgi:hypothetical protein
MIKPSWISFGGTAGIVTSMALIAGLDAAKTGRASMVSALLIAAVADNLTDSLSVHMYQESERLEQKEAFIGTLSNFVTRLLLCLSFVLIVVLLPEHITAIWGLVGGIIACGADLFARSVSRCECDVRSGKTSRGRIGNHPGEPTYLALDRCTCDLKSGSLMACFLEKVRPFCNKFRSVCISCYEGSEI